MTPRPSEEARRALREARERREAGAEAPGAPGDAGCGAVAGAGAGGAGAVERVGTEDGGAAGPGEWRETKGSGPAGAPQPGGTDTGKSVVPETGVPAASADTPAAALGTASVGRRGSDVPGAGTPAEPVQAPAAAAEPRAATAGELGEPPAGSGGPQQGAAHAGERAPAGGGVESAGHGEHRPGDIAREALRRAIAARREGGGGERHETGAGGPHGETARKPARDTEGREAVRSAEPAPVATPHAEAGPRAPRPADVAREALRAARREADRGDAGRGGTDTESAAVPAPGERPGDRAGAHGGDTPPGRAVRRRASSRRGDDRHGAAARARELREMLSGAFRPPPDTDDPDSEHRPQEAEPTSDGPAEPVRPARGSDPTDPTDPPDPTGSTGSVRQGAVTSGPARRGRAAADSRVQQRAVTDSAGREPSLTEPAAPGESVDLEQPARGQASTGGVRQGPATTGPTRQGRGTTDATGREPEVIDSTGRESEVIDSLGRQSEVTDPAGREPGVADSSRREPGVAGFAGREPALTGPSVPAPASRSMAAPARDGELRRTFPALPARPAGEGPFAETWWGNAWVAALEEGALDAGRLVRGRGYAARGHVDAITVTPGLVLAYVQGTRPRPYRVQVRLRTLDDAGWDRFLDAAAERPGHIAALLDKELPHSLADCGVPLLPGPGDLAPQCSCPDSGHPCKHAAALCYQTARLLDADPFVLLLLRGRGERRLLDSLSRLSAARAARAARDRAPASLPGIRATDALARRELPAPPPPLPAPPHPGQPPVYPAASGGPDPFALDQLATDAAARAHALLITGRDPVGGLTLWQDAVRLAAARPGSGLTASTRSLYSSLATATGRTPGDLARAVAAWRQGGLAGLAALDDLWDPPAGRFDRARPLLLAADLPAFRPWHNTLTHPGGHLQLRLGRDGLWYAYESEPGHDDWWPRGTPDLDPVGALTGLGPPGTVDRADT
ncbi:SWIM zinc finger family protein [Streptomyces sp. NPDC005925]|uniref:SWIM zinc finger family protein n=1 Tax=Streptomyces sp. NPDC005925 TaxID=3157172 RepID=UPI0033D4A05F